jgi:hypothetical protein
MRSLFFQIIFIVFGRYRQQMQTFLRYVQRGIYDLDWGSEGMLFDLIVGWE